MVNPYNINCKLVKRLLYKRGRAFIVYSKVRSKLYDFISWIMSDRGVMIWGGAFLIYCFLEVFLLGIPSLYLRHVARGLALFIKEYVFLGLF